MFHHNVAKNIHSALSHMLKFIREKIACNKFTPQYILGNDKYLREQRYTNILNSHSNGQR